MSKYLIHELDADYKRLYTRAINATQMEHSQSRYERFYNLLQFFHQTTGISGATAEAGCWRGLSSYLMLASRNNDPYRKHVILDSFEGLSEPAQEDLGHYSPDQMQGRFACDLDTVFENLKEFEGRFVLHPGWLPQSLTPLTKVFPETTYSFVHIDVEMFEPTYECLKYFWPRMNSGGVIVCDDCGYVSFPGSNKAMSKFCDENSLRPIYLTTGNGVLIKS